MRVRGTEVARGGIMAGHQLAMDPGDAIGQLAGIPTTEPAFGLPAVWIADAGRAEAEALGWTVVDAESVVVTHLTETIRAHAAELLTRQETRQLLDQLKEVNAAVVDEVVPGRALARRDPARAAGAAARGRLDPRPRRGRRGDRRQGAPHARPGDARRVRAPGARAHDRRALPRRRGARCARSRSTRRSSRRSPRRSCRPPTASSWRWTRRAPSALVDACAEQVEEALARGGRPVLLCSARVRRHLRRLCEQRLPQLAVCSYNEIAAGVGVETIGMLDPRRWTLAARVALLPWRVSADHFTGHGYDPRDQDVPRPQPRGGAAADPRRARVRTPSCCAAARASRAASAGSSSARTSRSRRAPRTADDAEVRNDRATAEGLASPAIQALVEQAAPFADALSRAQTSAHEVLSRRRPADPGPLRPAAQPRRDRRGRPRVRRRRARRRRRSPERRVAARCRATVVAPPAHRLA